MPDKVLFIVRGLPGSGKSTVAGRLSYKVREADKFPGLYNTTHDGTVIFNGGRHLSDLRGNP